MKKELESKNGSENAIHFVDILMQHSELQTLTNDDGATLRDQFMAPRYFDPFLFLFHTPHICSFLTICIL